MQDAQKQHDGAVVTAILGGAWAILVSVGLAASLPLRGVDFNALNLLTLITATLAGAMAIGSSRRPGGEGLLLADLLMLAAAIPTVFGWVIFLYIPALVMLGVATVMFVVAPVQRDA
ncbi:MAG: hypothetical protein ACRDJJ_06995 [Actinomycetota bacterium]